MQNTAPRIPKLHTKWYAAFLPILSEIDENPRRPPALDSAVPDRTIAIAEIPSAVSSPFSCEIIASPHDMLVMNMNQIDHHSLLFSM